MIRVLRKGRWILAVKNAFNHTICDGNSENKDASYAGKKTEKKYLPTLSCKSYLTLPKLETED